jgi:hypothetical protein
VTSVLKRTVIGAVAALAAGILLATPANAEPGDNPCELAFNFFCRFIPIAPDLEGNIDLTQQQPPADPNAPPPESLPVVDPCAAGCI